MFFAGANIGNEVLKTTRLLYYPNFCYLYDKFSTFRCKSFITMKFPSLKNLAESAIKTIKRFPFELLFALAGTIAATINIELQSINRAGENWCVRVMMIANLGLLLNLAATLYAESRDLPPRKKYLLNGVAVIAALGLLFLINPGLNQADYVRFFLLSLGFHFLVAFAAFTNNGHIQGFWQFNKTLFLRFLTAFLYGIVLFLGLSAAISAMNYLFNFKFEWDTYSILFTWIVGVFSTTFFLAGVPDDFKLLDEDDSYPKGLKIFTQYVLIPLATVYVLILLAYEVKIIVQWNLPKGAVSYLILSYAVFGILSLLLVYPIREREENKWLKTYARSFYFLMIPLLALLFIAAGVRLFEYGITEFRYFLLALSCWLLFITVYFLFFKKQNIKLIPMSLCIITLFTVYGPQSAFSVSMYSQRNILIGILKRNNSYKDDKFLPVKKINKNDGNNAVAVLDYLVKEHDITSLQPYINKNLALVSDSLSKLRSNYNKAFTMESYELRAKKLDWIKHYLGLEKFSGDRDDDVTVITGNNTNTIYYFETAGNITDINGYSYFVDAKSYVDTNSETHDGIKFVERKTSISGYSLQADNENVSFDLGELAKKLISSKNKFDKDPNNQNGGNSQSYIVPANLLLLTKKTAHFTITLALENIRVAQSQNGDIEIEYAAANYLVKKN